MLDGVNRSVLDASGTQTIGSPFDPARGHDALVNDGETFVRGLASAVPEVFAGIDLRDEYDYSASASDDGWARTIALADAVKWIEAEALVVDRVTRSTVARADADNVLRRFFAYMERVIASDPRGSATDWIMVELFEGIPWVEDVIDNLGPHTVDLLRHAQVVLQPFNGWIGRWSE